MRKRLLTIYLLLFCCGHSFAQTADSTLVHGKIPIDAARWYQLDNVSNGLQQLFDGELHVRPNTGWGKILSNFDAYYPVLPGEQISIDSIRMYDWEGNMEAYPMTLSVITDTWQRIPIAAFIAARYDVWNGPDTSHPDVYALDTVIPHIKYIVLNAWYEYPTEIEFYGTYKPPTPVSVVVKQPVKLKNFFGVNAFEWDFENPSTSWTIDTTRMKAIKVFTGVRHYMDWQKLESNEGSYTFNPIHSGGWNYDIIYQRCKAEGIEVLACLKTMPDWLQATYPADQRDAENTPVPYDSDFSNPASYIRQAKVAFQYAARYGSNPNVDSTLLSVNDTPRWTNDPVNQVIRGLGVIKYIECDNERDKWWKGRKAYQTGREYAANLSAFYDGNKNTMGAGAGVKNADPNMMVVMGGLASANPDYVRGMIDWCKEYRGYKSDSSVNLAWDIINYHFYCNDAASTSNGWPTTGIAPELAGADSVANNFIKMAHQYAADMPVWVTETGYDTCQHSPQKAIAIGTKSVLQTQADWTLRTSLLYARTGIQKTFFYELCDDNPWSWGPYATSGLINDNRTRRPAADFILQTSKLFGEYTYKETISKDPVADHYILKDSSMYMLVVPDETGRTASYTLNLGTADSAFIYTPQAGSDTMSVIKTKTTYGKLCITVTETPEFVIPVGTYTDSALERIAHKSKKATDSNNQQHAQQSALDSAMKHVTTDHVLQKLQVHIFPNPAVSTIMVEGMSVGDNTALSLADVSGKTIERKTSNMGTMEWNISNLTPGTYYITAESGNDKSTAKFVKE